MNPGSVLMPAMPQQIPQPSPSDSVPLMPKPWLVLPMLTGGLLWLSYFPLGWGFLGWVALIPLLLLVRLDARPLKIYFGSFLGGCLFFWLVLSWILEVDLDGVSYPDYRMVFLWGLLATYCALYFPAALFLIRRLDGATKWPLTITVPLVWTGLEYFRSFFGTGFAWYFLGHSQHHYLPVIQAADLGGVYVISFVMAAANGWCVEYMIFVLGPPISRRRFGFTVLALVTALFGYGGWRLSQDQFTPGPRVALLQGNIVQRFGKKDVQTAQEIEKYYQYLCGQALNLAPVPDLIVWPESSYPFPWIELPQDLNKLPAEKREAAVEDAIFFQNRLRNMARQSKTNQLIGLGAHLWNDAGEDYPYSSALMLTGQGNAIGRYDKVHRVPFGEYVPFLEWLPFLHSFVPYNASNSIHIGEKLTRFPLGAFHFGVLICYEDTDPYLARQYARQAADGPAADFFLNISNDGWFDGSSQHPEHLAISRFRAIETRRSVARAVNMGISAVIDSNGRVQQPIERAQFGEVKIWSVEPDQEGNVPDLPEGRWRDFTKVHGVLAATIPIDKRLSVYAWTGDWLPLGCWLLIGGVWVWRRLKRRLKPLKAAATIQ